ncbi:STAS domain-containing protein [Mesoterricola silvestris]|uniref:STAS domain-containing protein n=1 Tax=Mesoterricola silvestris TaxID=2927979 RepID=A0AA48GGU9_9BACT|nr:STAS domain-containing protein [Mesoterricola silvestris]BDU72581.1 hypothetical protein METEAL_17550 [Mesoterricola silvestris]
MTRKQREEPGPPEAVAPGPGVDLDIFGIQPFLKDARDWVAGTVGPVLRLDLSQVGDLDLSGLQVLLAMDLALRAKGSALVLLGVRDEWAARMERLGLGQLLEGGRKVGP